MVAAQGDWRKPSYHIDKGAFDLQSCPSTRKEMQHYDVSILNFK